MAFHDINLPVPNIEPLIESLNNFINEIMNFVMEVGSIITSSYSTICSIVYDDHEKIREFFFKQRYKPFKPLLKPYNHRPVMQRAYNKKPP